MGQSLPPKLTRHITRGKERRREKKGERYLIDGDAFSRVKGEHAVEEVKGKGCGTGEESLKGYLWPVSQ